MLGFVRKMFGSTSISFQLKSSSSTPILTFMNIVLKCSLRCGSLHPEHSTIRDSTSKTVPKPSLREINSKQFTQKVCFVSGATFLILVSRCKTKHWLATVCTYKLIENGQTTELTPRTQPTVWIFKYKLYNLLSKQGLFWTFIKVVNFVHLFWIKLVFWTC